MLLKLLTPLALAASALAACSIPTVSYYASPQYSQQFEFSGYFNANGDPNCNNIRLYRSSSSGSTATPLDIDANVDIASGTFTFTYNGAALQDNTYTFVVRLASADASDISARSNQFQIQLATGPCPFPSSFSFTDNAQIKNRKTPIAGTAADSPGCDTLTYSFISGPRAGQAYTTYFSPGQPFTDEQLYYYYNNNGYYLANGQYQLQVDIASSQSLRTTSSRTINFSVIGGGRCPVPTITSPPEGSAFFVPSNPILRGTVPASRPDCNIIRYTIYDFNGNPSTSSVNANPVNGPGTDPVWEFYLSTSPYGDFSVELFSAIDYDQTLESSNLVDFSYSYNDARCEPPVIELPTENAYLRTLRPTISGTQTNPAACPFVRLANIVPGSFTDNIPVAANGAWSFTPTEDLVEQAYYIYPQTFNAAGEELSSVGAYRYFTLALRCQAPYIITYATTVDGRNLHVESQGNTNDPDCQIFTFYNNGQGFGTGVPTSDSTIVSLDKTNLPNGAYSLTVVLGTGQLASDPSTQPYEFTIGNSPSVSAPEVVADDRRDLSPRGACARRTR
jgi:hypothetical protein